MSTFIALHQISLLVFLIIVLAISISNLCAFRRLVEYEIPPTFPRVSLLVPVRNEEATIEVCIRSLMSQNYPDFQVIVINDGSTDNTRQLLNTLQKNYVHLKVLDGRQLPTGWIGKNWACHQLAQAADGELLAFTDADTYHHPQTLLNSVAALIKEEIDLLSVFPQQRVVSWAEKLVLPVITWSFFSFLPLCLAYRLRMSRLSAANGQFMMFRRRAYEQIGGHRAVRQEVVDDLALVKNIKTQGLCWRLLNGKGRIHCRMYRSMELVYQGLTKNLFAAFNYSMPIFLLTWLWIGIVFLEPVVLLILGVTGCIGSELYTLLAAISVVLSLIVWLIPNWIFGLPFYLTLLYPITIILAIVVAMNSMILTISGHTTWKGRRIAAPRRHLSKKDM